MDVGRSLGHGTLSENATRCLVWERSRLRWRLRLTRFLSPCGHLNLQPRRSRFAAHLVLVHRIRTARQDMGDARSLGTQVVDELMPTRRQRCGEGTGAV